jgi:thiamine pyrophosphokinase
MIVRSDRPVTLVGGADVGPGDLETALALAPTLVAVDGGAGACRAAGADPVAVIGDMDSLSPDAAEAYCDRLHPITEQETTDFDKALRNIAAPLVIAAGFSGGRFDHELAVLHSLLRHADRPCIVLGAVSLSFLCPPELRLDLRPGTVVSLFPLRPCRTESEGLRWPTAGIDFAPDGRIGTSNEALGPIRLRAPAPGMLAILPRGVLPLLAPVLAAGPRWRAL